MQHFKKESIIPTVKHSSAALMVQGCFTLEFQFVFLYVFPYTRVRNRVARSSPFSCHRHHDYLTSHTSHRPKAYSLKLTG